MSSTVSTITGLCSNCKEEMYYEPAEESKGLGHVFTIAGLAESLVSRICQHCTDVMSGVIRRAMQRDFQGMRNNAALLVGLDLDQPKPIFIRTVMPGEEKTATIFLDLPGTDDLVDNLVKAKAALIETGWEAPGV